MPPWIPRKSAARDHLSIGIKVQAQTEALAEEARSPHRRVKKLVEVDPEVRYDCGGGEICPERIEDGLARLLRLWNSGPREPQKKAWPAESGTVSLEFTGIHLAGIKYHVPGINRRRLTTGRAGRGLVQI